MKRAPSLSAFSDEELQAEVSRRLQAKRDEKDRDPIPWCFDCEHYKTWPRDHDPPDDFNPCSKRHKMHFHNPLDYDEAHRGEYGFYLRRCKDRSPPCAAELL